MCPDVHVRVIMIGKQDARGTVALVMLALVLALAMSMETSSWPTPPPTPRESPRGHWDISSHGVDSSSPPPLPRPLGEAASVVVSGCVWVFGGRSESVVLGETWTWCASIDRSRRRVDAENANAVATSTSNNHINISRDGVADVIATERDLVDTKTDSTNGISAAVTASATTTTTTTSSSSSSRNIQPSNWTRHANDPISRSGLAAVVTAAVVPSDSNRLHDSNYQASKKDRRESIGQETQVVVMILGGMLTNGSSTSHAAVFVPTTGVWHTIPSMPTPRNGLGAVVVGTSGSDVLAIGGYDTARASGGFDGHVDVVESIDLTESMPKWSRLPPMLCPRSGFGVTVSADRAFVYVAGGATVGHEPLRSVELFDVQLSQWRELPPLVRARTYLGLALIDMPLQEPPASVSVRDRADTMRNSHDRTGRFLSATPCGRWSQSRASPAPISPVALLAFGGTNCSTTVRVNGTERCVSMPTTESLNIDMCGSHTTDGVGNDVGSRRTVDGMVATWEIISGGDLPRPVHAGAVVSVVVGKFSTPCVLGGETLSNIDTSAVQCWVEKR